MIYIKEKKIIYDTKNNVNITHEIDSDEKRALMFNVVKKYMDIPFNEKVKYEYSINLLMFVIGYYDFYQFLDEIYTNNELRNFYQLNIFHYCSLGAIFKNNKETIGKLSELNNIAFNITDYEKILNDGLKHPNHDIYKYCNELFEIKTCN